MQKQDATNKSNKLPEKNGASWKGWLGLAVLIILLSGVFQNSNTFMKAFDFTNLSGNFGNIITPTVKDGKIVVDNAGNIATTKYTYQGINGAGAREGFMVALGLIPLTAFAFGLIEWASNMGAMDAAERAFRYILRPLYGIPGICGIAYVASFTSSDVGAVMTRQLYEEGKITDDERTIFISYQYPATAVIGNTISTQAALLPYILISPGAAILVLWICKTIGANLVRLLITFENRRKKNLQIEEV